MASGVRAHEHAIVEVELGRSFDDTSSAPRDARTSSAERWIPRKELTDDAFRTLRESVRRVMTSQRFEEVRGDASDGPSSFSRC